SNFSIGKMLANRIINQLDTVNCELSLTSFDFRNFLNREFTNSKLELVNEINKLKPAAGSLLTAAFLDEPAGAFKINQRGSHDKVIILLTDCAGKYDTDAVRNALIESGAKLFVISLRQEPLQSLKDLAIGSGGWWFELTEQSKLNSVVYSVVAMSKDYKPCTLNWSMDYSCSEEHFTELLIPSKSIKDEFEFTFRNNEKSRVISEPQFLGFKSVDVGSKKQLSLTITAKNEDIFITELKIDPPFSIISGNVSNHLLQKDEFINITVEYEPVQEAIVFSRLEIISDACEVVPIYITGGFPNTKPTEKTVKILFPNGGDYLIIGDTAFVQWLGLLPEDVIQLEYSIDNGLTWLPLATNVTGLTKEWVVPDTPSDSCLVKIIQLWPNNVGFTLDLKHKGAVNSAFFNKAGDLVLTASSDTSAVVWVANTGEKKFTLNGHTKPILWAAFDPKDEFMATTGNDSSVIIWNMVDGSINTILEEHTTKVECVNFSVSGDYLVSSDFHGYSIIWDRNWNILKRVKSNDVGPTRYSEFNPVDEDLIICANGDGKAKVWNWRDYSAGAEPEVVYATNSNLCSHATYNEDATKVAVTTSSGEPKKLFVWDVAFPDNPIYEISHNSDTSDNNSINTSSFFYHPDLGKEVLLTTSTDETARLWDASDGSPTRINDFITDNIFREHSNSVTTAVFDRFGTRLLTASWDSTAKIWNLNQKELQQDISDSVFTIAYARGKGMEIDMGTVYLGELKDSIIRAVFVNESEFEYSVNSYSFSGPGAGDFEILTDLNFPLKVKSSDSIPLEIRFYPKETGLRVAELEFELPAGVLIKSEIKGFCDLADLKINYPVIDMGIVEVGSFKDSTFTIIMTNESGAAVEIDSISIVGSYSSNFSALNNNSKILQNGESIPVTLRFSPDIIGRKNAQYKVNYKGKGSPRLSNLFGEGRDFRNDSISLYIKDVAAFPGDVFKLPIYVGKVGNSGISDNISGFSANLRFNTTLLEPLSGFKKSTISGYDRIIELELPKTFGPDSILHEIEFRALWGNDTISNLNLEYTVPTGTGRIAVEESSGIFKLEGVCLTDGVLRLFIPNGDLMLGQTSPNPAQSRASLTFSVFEKGNTKIVLFDIMGNELLTIAEDTYSPGSHSISFDISDLPQGLYYYTMFTPSNVIRKSMLITR
ncbi:MAG: choice-of-anchor D domain-containing protein, partial [Candidatus Kapaibacterium sp.]